MALKYQVVPVTPFMQNCTLLWCDETLRTAIVDPGGDVPRIVSAIESLGLSPEKILVTHGHLDHAGGVFDLAQELGIPIEGPQRADKFWIDAMQQQGAAFGLSGVFHAFTPERWLEHGDRVNFGNIEMEVLHCPGHTPGHVVFFHAPSRLLVSGDVLFQGSIGRTDFPKGDFDTLISSIRTRLWPLGDDVRFISGHGPMSTIGAERMYNPFCAD
ncbi:MAG: MBL fold metallo-hydrolase [Candidatus Accumulibacter sp.]|jgi:glyoxylase-like metal-dependent hydrolase (beta-lactamase superfamily II)|nr:MBL fold metallo-hydrolase [Accumulibacter sp.]